MASWFWEWRFQVGRLCQNPNALRANRHEAVGCDECARGRRAANPSHHHLVARFKGIRNEISELGQAGNVQQFVERWLGEQVAADEPFQVLARELSTSADTAAGLLEALIAAVSLPDIPPDVAEVRIMSLHKSRVLVRQS